MKKFEFTLQNEHGLHARPAGLFIQVCGKYTSSVNIYKDGNKFNGKSMLGILKMGASKGDVLTVEVDGADEAEAIEALKDLVDSNFDE